MTRFVNAWTDTVVQPGISRLIVRDILDIVAAKDRDYFRTSREQRYGVTLEAVCADREQQVVAFRQSLMPARTLLAAQPYLGAARATYADYILFGAFQWARCVSVFRLLEDADPVAQWRERMLDAFAGLARNALAA